MQSAFLEVETGTDDLKIQIGHWNIFEDSKRMRSIFHTNRQKGFKVCKLRFQLVENLVEGISRYEGSAVAPAMCQTLGLDYLCWELAVVQASQ